MPEWLPSAREQTLSDEGPEDEADTGDDELPEAPFDFSGGSSSHEQGNQHAQTVSAHDGYGIRNRACKRAFPSLIWHRAHVYKQGGVGFTEHVEHAASTSLQAATIGIRAREPTNGLRMKRDALLI